MIRRPRTILITSGRGNHDGRKQLHPQEAMNRKRNILRERSAAAQNNDYFKEKGNRRENVFVKERQG